MTKDSDDGVKVCSTRLRADEVSGHCCAKILTVCTDSAALCCVAMCVCVWCVCVCVCDSIQFFSCACVEVRWHL